MEYDLLNLPYEVEKRTYKLKRTVPAPNSYFLKIKSKDKDTTQIVFSNAQSNIVCPETGKQLARCTGGKIKLDSKAEYMILGRNKNKN